MSRYRHLGLAREPFAAEPDLAFQAPTLGQADALARLTDFVDRRGAIALVLGECGIGKSMLRMALARDLAPRPAVRIVTLDRPDEWGTDVAFLRSVSVALGGDANGRTTLELLTEIETMLAGFAADDHRPLLLIDDAHRLTSSQLELLRTISSVEPNSLSIILFAEPDLDERVARRRSLNGRVELRHTLNPLNSRDVKAVIEHRIAVAGSSEGREVFDSEALVALAERSDGVPGALIPLAAKAIDFSARRGLEVIDRTTVNDAAGYRQATREVARQIAFDLDGLETAVGP